MMLKLYARVLSVLICDGIYAFANIYSLLFTYNEVPFYKDYFINFLFQVNSLRCLYKNEEK